MSQPSTQPAAMAVPPAPSSHRRHALRALGMALGALVLLALAATNMAALATVAARLGTPASMCAPASDGTLLAGAGQANITPADTLYLGGYGVGAVRRASGVLMPLEARALALRSTDGQPAHTVVLVSLDSQGYFAAYQAGPYGLDAIRAAVTRRDGIPAAQIIIASTHSHSAPDTVGFWGGVPTSYLALVRHATLDAIAAALHALRPARLSTGSASSAGYTSTFGGASAQAHAQWPTDDQLRVLQATDANSGATIATLINVSVHPTALGADNTLVSPDWPGVTSEQVASDLGGSAMVMVGALGHTWPALPAGAASIRTTTLSVEQRQAARAWTYGQAIAEISETAVAHARPVAQPALCVADIHFRVADTSAPLLLALQTSRSPVGTHILRATTAPYYLPPNVLGAEVEAVRIGDVGLLAAPVEPYPSLLATLRQQLATRPLFVLGLANDQLGYAALPDEYAGILAKSPDDEALFVVSPGFGATLVTELNTAARQAGIR